MKKEAKERPKCREVIMSRRLRPHVDRNGIWDGIQGRGKDGAKTMLSHGLRTQMRKMIKEGVWEGVLLAQEAQFFPPTKYEGWKGAVEAFGRSDMDGFIFGGDRVWMKMVRFAEDPEDEGKYLCGDEGPESS
jgi:hypothetical protein